MYKLLFVAMAMVSLSWGSIGMAYEEAPYTIISQNGPFEVRAYSDRLAVQTQETGGQNSAFQKLFKYISGANQTAEQVSMTVPVTQSEKIAMTVPVTQAVESDAKMMQFYLPAKYTYETAPRPLDPSVELRVIPSGTFAVVKFSGRSTQKNFEKHAVDLKSMMAVNSMEVGSDPIFATYNGPFTPFFARRNEVMIRLK